MTAVARPPLPLEPHFIIETSPGKRYEYFLIDGAPVEGQEWEAVQTRIVDNYGSDPNAKDRCRVLRLAGFFI
jgi:RepB DNA-primase N-terminal domain